jgi:diadenosine tetraphosphate (Ap4A) HIT family hydrolase
MPTLPKNNNRNNENCNRQKSSDPVDDLSYQPQQQQQHDDYNTNETVFGCILRGEKSATIVAESGQFLAFHDHKPGAPIHYLIIPKQRIDSVLDLQVNDVTTLHDMKLMAQQLVNQRKRHSLGSTMNQENTTRQNNNNNMTSRFVFHIPPFYSVKHLHLHVLTPVSQMKWFYRYIKFPAHDTFWCISIDTVVDRLKRGESPVPWNCWQYLYTKQKRK